MLIVDGNTAVVDVISTTFLYVKVAILEFNYYCGYNILVSYVSFGILTRKYNPPPERSNIDAFLYGVCLNPIQVASCPFMVVP